ncbi:MAG: penicillin-binding protein 2 [Prevotellaceae bacterium]|jgi:penicillin-binding protein 2|nr:penicillin-binding protein 2 [Prevotellaceae bacterium]
MNNPEDDNKKKFILCALVIISLILIIRLFYIQVIDDSYKNTANNNVLRYEVQFPARGLIFDRNGKLIVGNRTVYDLLVVPLELKAFDTLEFCAIFNISPAYCKTLLDDVHRRRKRIGYQAAVFMKQVPAETYGVFQEKAYKYPGFYVQARTLRNYPRNIAGNLLGYVTETDKKILEKNPYYKMGDYIGRTGIEERYEDALRGEKGVNIYVRDVNNRIRASYEDGAHDEAAVSGKNIVCTIDSDLQEYSEHLMRNKVGSLVAIEPATGEILAFVSSPGIDPSLLVGINRNFQALQQNALTPLFNRAAMSPYPPGSVFKLANGLIGLQEKTLTPNTRYGCAMGYKIGRGVACHAHPSPTNLRQSIQMSCNAYYCYAFRNIIDNPKYHDVEEAFLKWREYVESFGFGKKLGTDIPNEQPGLLPSVRTYDRIHGKDRWKSLSIISLAIGQGEIGATPLHLANFAATIANRGYYYTPHVVRNVVGSNTDTAYTTRHYTGVDTAHFGVIVDGMYLAVNGGAGSTAGRSKIADIDLCGKTGTAQNPHGANHSVFICFAPRDNPTIAIVAYLENAGWGGSWAAPIASLMTEKYINGEVLRDDLEADIVSKDFIKDRKLK